MSQLLLRIQKLMALSSSPNEHEARNAAFQAVRLMLANGLVPMVPPPAGYRFSLERIRPGSLVESFVEVAVRATEIIVEKAPRKRSRYGRKSPFKKRM